MFDRLAQTVRYCLRALRKDPSTSVPAVLALALGLGLTTAQFAVTDAVMFRGLPFEEGHEIVYLTHQNLSEGIDDMSLSAHDFEIYDQRQEVFDDFAAFTQGTINISEPDERPVRLSGGYVTANFLDLLAIEPLHGRGFIAGEDDASGAEPVALLSYSVWQSRYGGDLDVVGRQVMANGQATTVIGIMPEGFSFPELEEIWQPLRDPAAEGARGTAEEAFVNGFARLSDDVTIDQAVNDLNVIARQLATEFPASNEGVTVTVYPFVHEYISIEARATVAAMFVTVFLVLLVACFNVANLLLARASRRTREIAIRTAMGASRARAIGLLLAESISLSVLGAVLSLPIAYWGIQGFDWAMNNMGEPAPYWFDLRLNFRVLVFAAGLALVTGLIAGLLPALRASRADVQEVLQDSSRGTSMRLGRLSRVLVTAEIAFSCALLVAAGVLVFNLRAIGDDILTFEPDGLLTFRVGLFETSYPDPESHVRFFQELEQRFEARADVERAAISQFLPADSRVGFGSGIYVEGVTYERPVDQLGASIGIVSPSFFDLLSVRTVDGRGFTADDVGERPPVVLVSTAFAERQFGLESPLGRRLHIDALDQDEDPWRTIIGVVPNLIGENFIEGSDEAVYLPMAQYPLRFAYVTVRPAAGDPLAFTDTARRVVEEQDANTPIYWVRSLRQVVDESRVVHQLISGTFTIFGIAALLLTVVGLYGVMAFSVRQRTQEIGVRMAFGARGVDVLGLVTFQGLKQVAVGLLIGLGLGYFLSRALQGFVYSAGDTTDPLVFVIVPAIFLLVAGIACLLPARRAARVDPIHALQHE